MLAGPGKALNRGKLVHALQLRLYLAHVPPLTLSVASRSNAARSLSSVAASPPSTQLPDGVTVVSDANDAKRVIAIINKLPKTTVHAVDTEVSEIDVKVQSPVGNGKVICASIFSGPDVDYGSGPRLWIDNLDQAEGILQAFKDVLEDKTILKAYHNYSFDRHVLFNHGIDAQGLAADTMHMARLLDSSRTVTGGYSLEALTTDYLGTPKVSMKALFSKPKLKKSGDPGRERYMPELTELQRDPATRNEWMRYSVLDAELTWKLRNVLQQKLEEREWLASRKGGHTASLWDLYKLYFVPFAECLTDMERAGIFVDKAALKEAEGVATQHRTDAERKFLEWAGKLWPEAAKMNVGSDTQKSHFLFAPCGKQKTRFAVPSFSSSTKKGTSVVSSGGSGGGGGGDGKKSSSRSQQPHHHPWLDQSLSLPQPHPGAKRAYSLLSSSSIASRFGWFRTNDLTRRAVRGRLTPPSPTGVLIVPRSSLSNGSGFPSLDDGFGNLSMPESAEAAPPAKKSSRKRTTTSSTTTTTATTGASSLASPPPLIEPIPLSIGLPPSPKKKSSSRRSGGEPAAGGAVAGSAAKSSWRRAGYGSSDSEGTESAREWILSSPASLEPFSEAEDPLFGGLGRKRESLLAGGGGSSSSGDELDDDDLFRLHADADHAMPDDIDADGSGGGGGGHVSSRFGGSSSSSSATVPVKALPRSAAAAASSGGILDPNTTTYASRKPQIERLRNQQEQQEAAAAAAAAASGSTASASAHDDSSAGSGSDKASKDKDKDKDKDKEPDIWPVLRTFKVPNTEGYIEPGAKKAKKDRPLTLVGLGMPAVELTASGWPAVSSEVLKTLAGKVDTAAAAIAAGKTPSYGLAYDYFGGGEEGKEACEALYSLYRVSTIDTMLSNFILPLQIMADKESRVHCSLNLNTETGRLSARRPNLQNQPALEKDAYGIRKAFRARPGCSLIVADYGQLELRLLAHLTNCRSMIEAFAAGGDFHSRTAMGMFPHVREAVKRGDVLLEAGDDPTAGKDKPLLKNLFASERRKAKVLNFSIAYGKTALGLAKDWNVSLAEAKETLEAWYSDRPEVKKWQRVVLDDARRDGASRTILGRYRNLPDISSPDVVARRHAERAAINTPIQGSAADVAMLAMLKLWRSERLKALGWRMLLQIHDEVILEGPTESAEEALPLVVADMGKPFATDLRVALSVDANIAQTWYEAK